MKTVILCLSLAIAAAAGAAAWQYAHTPVDVDHTPMYLMFFWLITYAVFALTLTVGMLTLLARRRLSEAGILIVITASGPILLTCVGLILEINALVRGRSTFSELAADFEQPYLITSVICLAEGIALIHHSRREAAVH